MKLWRKLLLLCKILLEVLLIFDEEINFCSTCLTDACDDKGEHIATIKSRKNVSENDFKIILTKCNEKKLIYITKNNFSYKLNFSKGVNFCLIYQRIGNETWKFQISNFQIWWKLKQIYFADVPDYYNVLLE